MRRTVWLCLLYLLCLPARGDAPAALQLSELDSRSRLLCASAMLYFDPRERAPDPRSLTAVFHHLNTLETHVLQLGRPAALAAPVQAMQRLFARLEKLPREQREAYPQLIGELLEQQRQLHLASAQALQHSAADDALRLFGEQSGAMSALLLDYLLRHYPLADKQAWLLPVASRVELDQDIEQRFDRLLEQHAAQAAALTKIRKVYRFVRRQLQQPGRDGSGGAEFYLSRAVLDLDELALSLGQGG